MRRYPIISPLSLPTPFYNFHYALLILLLTLSCKHHPINSFMVLHPKTKINNNKIISASSASSSASGRRNNLLLSTTDANTNINNDRNIILQQKWEDSYKRDISENGFNLCALAYEGFLTNGRGAILFHEQSSSTSKSKYDVSLKETKYITQKEWLDRMNKTPQSVQNIQEILKRINSYNPNFEYCVVYQSIEGIMGCDVIKPDTKPKDILQLVQEQLQEEKIYKDNEDDDDDNDVIESTDW